MLELCASVYGTKHNDDLTATLMIITLAPAVSHIYIQPARNKSLCNRKLNIMQIVTCGECKVILSGVIWYYYLMSDI